MSHPRSDSVRWALLVLAGLAFLGGMLFNAPEPGLDQERLKPLSQEPCR